ncbi:MAG: hypothetical protein ACD_79C01299G0001 [uncultured bacterium]|nr:MAG: hypothetical protein ACD_79C01299G0001 [uncultured bacterium]
MLNSAHQGYIYQDILGAYFVAQELALGNGSTKFHFDYKKTPNEIPDKFDDLVIYYEAKTLFIQIKYSNDEHQHALTKNDFSSSSSYDLALFDLFKTWKSLNAPGSLWRICLAWDKPEPADLIQQVLIQLPDNKSLLLGTTCYQFNSNVLWPENGEVLSSWRALQKHSKSIERIEFKEFLDNLILEVNCPKSTLLQDYNQGLEKLLAQTIERIGVGIYPNDHLTVRQVAESLCTIVKRRRATNNNIPISCDEIAKEINIIQAYGGIEQKFIIDENIFVATPNRVDQVVSVLEQHKAVILTAEPGAGKSWFIENLENYLKPTAQIIKHYCYIALEDPLALKRIKVNTLYGSLITQILHNDESLGYHKTYRYASNLEELNILLKKIQQKTLLIIDGIDHIWRIYQKNRGGLTEDDTKILEALAKLDYSNHNVSLLIVSQPIDKLTELTPFHHCTLAPLTESFVEDLLEKHRVSNVKIEEISLACMIHEKSNGNALYCKYLIDHAVINKIHTSFDWFKNLPPYEFNLKGYYQYLYEQIQGDTRVPYALCGADFSLSVIELQEITHLGKMVLAQLTLLQPILNYTPALGYSIYHESFKRFVIDFINDQGASINDLIYQPLIIWLEKYSFFKSIKAYGHLLKLYYEVDDFDSIAKSISVNFLNESLYNAQPLHYIRQNHRLQKISLQYIKEFTSIIIIAEQSKIFEVLDHLNSQTLINYLKAVHAIHGEELMYRVLWDGEHLLVEINDALRFFVNQAYQGNGIIHWSVIPRLDDIPYEILGMISVKFLHMKQYEKFDALIKNVYENPEHRKAFEGILDELEWWSIYFGNDWINETPYFHSIIMSFKPSSPTLQQAIESIILNEKFIYDDNWKIMLRDVVMLVKTASKEEKEAAISTLSQYNWFRNWLIYLIKITDLSEREYNNKELIDAFSYLVRDLDPFKGTPRVCDLYKQNPFIKKSFHRGLLLCRKNKVLLTQCCNLLENVTKVATSLKGSVMGPLTDEDYLELITSYLSGENVISKYEEYYRPLGSGRYYSDVAEIAFKYAQILKNAGLDQEAKEKYREGIQAVTAYGFHKDRTLSEVLDCSVPYQKIYGTLQVEWFYNLYRMAMTVVSHTDGKSTSYYPVEWFKEFIKVYSEEALRHLVSETYENKKAYWHQEEEFLHVLEEYPSLFTPTQWFLLCRSIPLASSCKIINNGLTFLDQIDAPLKDVYNRWLQALPFVIRNKEDSQYTQEMVTQFKERFGIQLESKKETSILEKYSHDEMSSHSPAFSAKSYEEILAFFEKNSLKENIAIQFQQVMASISDWEYKKEILRQVAGGFKYGRNIGHWVDNIFEPHSQEWLYFNICLFVFVTDGWGHGLHNSQYLRRVYEKSPEYALNMLKEVLGYFLSGNTYISLVSCNLIKALSELKVEESMVSALLQTTFKIVKHRLPHPPNCDINTLIYQGLEGLNRDEMVVALLIARLKTLTTEKTQGIIWSLIFLAQSSPKSLFKPYFWAFSNHTFLLPIHRAVLLQILKEYVDQSLIPDELIGNFLSIYPTGFFLEDQYIRSFVNYKIEMDEISVKSIQLSGHSKDKIFFPSIHIKYEKIAKHEGTLTGTYNAFVHKREIISKEYESYYIRTENLMTPIVPISNAFYEIINSQFYTFLKQITHNNHKSFTCNLDFFLNEIVIQISALTRRPTYLPFPEKFPLFEVRSALSPFEHEGWVMLASKEDQLTGEQLKPKKNISSSLVIFWGQKPESDGDFCSEYIFKTNLYAENNMSIAPFDHPICELIIIDKLERSCIVYVSPFIIRELGLKLDPSIHSGFQARNDQGEVVIKMLTWKEDYYGKIDDGTEIPRREGVAVMIRKDFYKRFLSFSKKESWFILSRKD